MISPGAKIHASFGDGVGIGVWLVIWVFTSSHIIAESEQDAVAHITNADIEKYCTAGISEKRYQTRRVMTP